MTKNIQTFLPKWKIAGNMKLVKFGTNKTNPIQRINRGNKTCTFSVCAPVLEQIVSLSRVSIGERNQIGKPPFVVGLLQH